MTDDQNNTQPGPQKHLWRIIPQELPSCGRMFSNFISRDGCPSLHPAQPHREDASGPHSMEQKWKLGYILAVTCGGNALDKDVNWRLGSCLVMPSQWSCQLCAGWHISGKFKDTVKNGDWDISSRGSSSTLTHPGHVQPESQSSKSILSKV